MRILDSDVVVRVTYVSETSDSLTFRTVEYLKGSGPSTVTITASTVGRPDDLGQQRGNPVPQEDGCPGHKKRQR